MERLNNDFFRRRIRKFVFENAESFTFDPECPDKKYMKVKGGANSGNLEGPNTKVVEPPFMDENGKIKVHEITLAVASYFKIYHSDGTVPEKLLDIVKEYAGEYEGNRG